MKILLAVDLSDASREAIRTVIEQFGHRQHEARLVHAVDWEEHLPPSYLFAQGRRAASAVVEKHAEIAAGARAAVDQLAAELRAGGFVVTTDVRDEGAAAEVILGAAAAWPADLIVTGSHGRSGLGRVMLGSVSSHIVHHAPCPVEVIRTRAIA